MPLRRGSGRTSLKRVGQNRTQPLTLAHLRGGAKRSRGKETASWSKGDQLEVEEEGAGGLKSNAGLRGLFHRLKPLKTGELSRDSVETSYVSVGRKTSEKVTKRTACGEGGGKEAVSSEACGGRELQEGKIGQRGWK